jgi:hypothetical protein
MKRLYQHYDTASFIFALVNRLHIEFIFYLIFFFKPYKLAADIFYRRLYIPEFFDQLQYIKIYISGVAGVNGYRCIFG